MIVSMKRCAAALGLVALASTASAQEARVGPRWLGWVGCWTASVPGAAAAESGGVVCITPSSQGADAVDVATISEGKVVSTQRIDASGTERPMDAKGCAGVQRASWSADERRIYLRSSATCDGLKSTTSGILSMTATGEWLDVRGVSSYGSQSVRVARYRDAGIPASVPAEIASALRERGGSAETARVAAGAPIGASGVVEASRAADSAVVAAWLLERGQRFSLDAKTLVQLADAGVPGAVTDALVAVSNPSVFRFARESQQSDVITTDAPRSGRRVVATAYPYDPWAWGTLGLDYGYRYGYPYGYRYAGYGYGYNNGYYGGYAPPIIIVTGNGQNTPVGQMVKGRGYTQTGGSSDGATARERPSRESSPPPSSSPSPSSSGSSSSGSSSGGSSSEGRTAKPRS
ncbi:MAG TPA: hypothetical protein VFS59_01670 [Gemmatimonadaceae bacterium]|nr:hypothetical protein [Gemmatimonadaceae bacterium]